MNPQLEDPFLSTTAGRTRTSLSVATSPESLYFAYGSNLSLAQMAARCPSSRFIGRAFLRGYRWIINQRGYANVVPCSKDGARVEGLCFLLTAEDEEVLDVCESVKEGVYDKVYIDVRLVVARVGLVGRLCAEIVGSKDKNSRDMEISRVLVYQDMEDVEDGVPQKEYVPRMDRAMEDAVNLGVDEKYVDEVMRPAMKRRGG